MGWGQRGAWWDELKRRYNIIFCMRFREFTRAFLLIKSNSVMQESLTRRVQWIGGAAMLMSLASFNMYLTNKRLPNARD
jgi:hypothetical protein